MRIPKGTFQIEPMEHRRLLSFGAPVSYPVNDNTTPLAADVNGDGRADLVTTSRDGNSVNVLLADADGSFQSVQNYPTAPSPVSLAAGDFNNDGYVDLVTADLYQWPEGGSISLLLGNGDGSFQPRRSSLLPHVDPLALTTGDFNQDGALDVAFAWRETTGGGPDVHPVHDDYLGVLLGDGGGAFTGMTSRFISSWGSWESEGMPLTLMAGDLDGDSTPDLILHGTLLSNQYLVTCAVPGNGDGTFGEPAWIPDSYGGSAVMTDLNGDDHADLATASSSVVWDGSAYQYRGWVNVWLANSDGTFQNGWHHSATGFTPTSLGVGDFDGDGRADLLTANHAPSDATVSVFRGNGDGTFQLPQQSILGAAPAGDSVAVADFNGDGRADVASANAGSDNVSVLLNDGNWTGKTFVGPGGAGSGGSWSTAANWSPSGVPDPGDSVAISGKSVNLAGNAAVASLTLTDGSTLALAANGSRVLRTSSISIGWPSKLDLNDNNLIFDYNAGSNGVAAYIAGLIAVGRTPARSWDGAGGIGTSMPQAAEGLTGLGVGEAANLLGLAAGETATWNGQSVDATTVLVKYTYAGDANLDGRIDAGDYGIIDNFVQVEGADGYANGDFNYDGFIDAGDYGIIDNNVQAQGAPIVSAVSAADGPQPVPQEQRSVTRIHMGSLNEIDDVNNEAEESLVRSVMEATAP